MTMITPSYLGETIEYSSLHACRSTLEDPTFSNISNNFQKCVNSCYWSLASGRILELYLNQNEPSVFKVWNTKQTFPVIYKIKEKISPIVLSVEDRKNFLRSFLPEGHLLSEIKDKIFRMSKEEEFLFRACCLVENFYEDFFSSDDLSVNLRAANMKTLFKNKCFYLEDDKFGILKKSKADASNEEKIEIYIYEQTIKKPNSIYQEEDKNNNDNDKYTISFKGNFLFPINKIFNNSFHLEDINCFTLNKNTLGIRLPIPDELNIYSFTSKNNAFYFEELKNINPSSTLKKSDSCIRSLDQNPLSNEEIIFQEDVTRSDYNISFNKFNLKTQQRVRTKFFIQRQVCHVEKLIASHLNFFISPVELTYTFFIYDTNNGSIQFVNYKNYLKDVIIMPNGNFLLQGYNDGFEVIEFPKLTQWLQRAQQTIDNELQAFLPKVIANTVSDYLAKDVRSDQFYGNFFNNKIDIFPEPEPKPKKHCSIM